MAELPTSVICYAQRHKKKITLSCNAICTLKKDNVKMIPFCDTNVSLQCKQASYNQINSVLYYDD